MNDTELELISEVTSLLDSLEEIANNIETDFKRLDLCAENHECGIPFVTYNTNLPIPIAIYDEWAKPHIHALDAIIQSEQLTYHGDMFQNWYEDANGNEQSHWRDFFSRTLHEYIPGIGTFTLYSTKLQPESICHWLVLKNPTMAVEEIIYICKGILDTRFHLNALANSLDG